MAGHGRIIIGMLVTVLGLTTLSACTSGEDATSSPRPAKAGPRGPQPPEEGAWMGAAVMPEEFTPAGRIGAFQEFERATGRKLDVVHTYHPWDEPFPTEVDKHFLAGGQQVLTGWGGSDSPGIAAGEYDDLIRQRAGDVKRLGKPIMMSLRWEMDRPNLQSQVRSADDFVAAWKHTRKIFDEVGATNVAWVWAPTAKGFTGGYAQDYYPGDDQVDWIAVHAYTGMELRPFSAVMSEFMAFARKRPSKPVMVAEFGLSDRGGKRPAWLAAARQYVKDNPQIKAVLYFNGNSEARPTAQLALQPSATGRKAFNEWLADPYFNTANHRVTEPR